MIFFFFKYEHNKHKGIKTAFQQADSKNVSDNLKTYFSVLRGPKPINTFH